MSQLLDNIGDTYKVIKGYLPRETALELAQKVRDSKDGDPEGSGGFIEGSCLDFGELPEMTAISLDNIGYLNKFIGGPKLLPTYTYTRIYEKGSVLPKHTDRSACEVSLSIHLDGDAPSKFHIRNKNKRVISIDLEPGDAILYDGPNAEHWRDAYEGESYVQTFHHYVFSGGKSEHQAGKTYSSLGDYIKVYRGMVPPQVCEYIVGVISQDYSTRWEQAKTVDPTTDVRVCETLSLAHTDHIDSTINEYVTKAIHEFCSTFKDFIVNEDKGYTCLRYFPNGKYDYHTDQHRDHNREVTLIINLNDTYEGGDLMHCEDKFKTKLGVGDICIFPSNFMFPHRIDKISSGIRYSIVTWAV